MSKASARTLTARGVRRMLGNRGVPVDELGIVETINANEVRIDGPKDARRAATRALALGYEDTLPGMWVTPYPTHDFLVRR